MEILEVYDNELLHSLSGLENLKYFGGDLNISDNPNLNYCKLNAICQHFLSAKVFPYITGNSDGCRSYEEIYNLCAK